jgi:hypothetical protein
MRKLIVVFLLAGFAVGGRTAAAQDAARPEDVGSIDGIVAAWYDIVSVAPGEEPDWGRDSTLYLPDIRFVILPDGESGSPAVAAVLSHAQFIEASSGGLADGFVEREIHRTTQRFGNMAHVFSTYEFRQVERGPTLGRGINSIQLFHDGERWWIIGAAWRNESEGVPIPEEFLP